MGRKWKYKIKSGKTSVILMFIMSALFCGLALWLYKTDNGAVIFVGIIAALMVVVFVLSVYRLIFYKVLIGSKGFYYQTGIGNGKYYDYADVEKAWISSGTAQNGGNEQYCNVALSDKRTIRFMYFYNDEKAIDYLVKKANETVFCTSIKEKDEYVIDGRTFGKARVVVGVIVLAIIALLEFCIFREVGFNFMLISGIALGAAVVYCLFINYLFFQVKICKDKFYCRTTPFNGRWYEYSDITGCKEIKKTVKRHYRGSGSHRTYYFYFEFTDKGGKTHKFQYEQQIHSYEVNVLKDHIEAAKNRQ